jgi:hypothetical protein
LYELDLLTVRWRQQQAREDRRAAMSAWLLANINRDSEHRHEPFRLEEVVGWLGHGFQRPSEAPAKAEPAPPPAEPMTVDQLKVRLDMMKWLHDQTQQNGG